MCGLCAAPRDRNTFSPVGPGARRGLNRLAGRPVQAVVPEPVYQREMGALFTGLAPQWPRSILGVPQEPLELHDLQFNCCEFDKASR